MNLEPGGAGCSRSRWITVSIDSTHAGPNAEGSSCSPDTVGSCGAAAGAGDAGFWVPVVRRVVVVTVTASAALDPRSVKAERFMVLRFLRSCADWDASRVHGCSLHEESSE